MPHPHHVVTLRLEALIQVAFHRCSKGQLIRSRGRRYLPEFIQRAASSMTASSAKLAAGGSTMTRHLNSCRSLPATFVLVAALLLAWSACSGDDDDGEQ